jgi:hypothetical protein
MKLGSDHWHWLKRYRRLILRAPSLAGQVPADAHLCVVGADHLHPPVDPGCRPCCLHWPPAAAWLQQLQHLQRERPLLGPQQHLSLSLWHLQAHWH